MPKLLMIVSSASQMRMSDGAPYPTGVWAEELYKPLKRFDAKVEKGRLYAIW